MNKKPSIGRIVHLKLRKEVFLPAIITGVNGDGAEQTCNLQVFRDGCRNNTDQMLREAGVNPGTGWRGSSREGTEIGDWCWPPIV